MLTAACAAGSKRSARLHNEKAIVRISRPLSGGSRPLSADNVLGVGALPIARIAQQLGLEYYDGTRAINITATALAETGGRGSGLFQASSSFQRGDDPRFEEA